MARSQSSRAADSSAVLAPLVLPAALVGSGCAFMLVALSALANRLEHVLWTTLPKALGVSGESAWWIITILTATGLAVGLVVWLAPGHAGPDPASTELVGAPLPLGTLPGLAAALVLALAGGVSLGPENPIIGVNVALTVVLMRRLLPKAPPQLGMLVAVSGTIAAMFGTPVAAALLVTEMAAMYRNGQLWDNLFVPLVAAAAGSITMDLLGKPVLSVSVAPYHNPRVVDLFTGSAVALVAAGLMLAVVYAFPLAHTAFRALRHPVLMITAGGLVLGLLGALGGTISLFKGLDEMKELTANAADYSTGKTLLITLVKLTALLVAASSGFRGGRIFPSVFVGVGVGLTAHDLVPSVQPALAISCGVLGTVIVAARDGWLALFLAAATVADVNLLPMLCVAVLPVWLLVRRRPLLLIEAPANVPQAAPS
ncbi:H+/Cl-antiporter ClcA [Frankineae bacterium MT45]|nr:H+/Cl-antiporter ClcA [Frankineae bacterium MT45]